MKRALALLLVGSLACRAFAQDTPDIVLTEDRETSSSEIPAVKLEDDQPDLAFADMTDPNPGSGLGQIVAGWIATGIGVVGVVEAPLCKYGDVSGRRSVRRCRNLGIAFGTIGLTFGIPWLVFGYQRRHEQRAWKKRHNLTALPELQVCSDELLLQWRF